MSDQTFSLTSGTNGSPACVIDSDAHITEPADLWTDRMSKDRWGDLIPTVKWDATGERQGWYIGDVRFADLGFSAVFRGEGGAPVRLDEPDETRGLATRAFYPRSFDEMHPSSWDVAERAEVMNTYGISAQCLFPNLLLFNSRVMAAAGHDAVAFSTEMTRSYNDFIRDISRESPGRIIPLACLPYWDIEESVKEIERCAEEGHRGLVMSGYPQQHGSPYLADLAWEPLWLAATAADLPIHFHAGSGDVSDHANSERSTVEGSSVLTSARQTTDILLTNAFSIADLLSSGVLVRHPELKFVSVESGVGWIPFVLESLDRHFEYYKVAKYRSEFELLPSEYFRRQVYTTVWFEELTDLHLATVGADNIMFETDYPHPTCLMGQDIQAAIDRSLGQLDERNRRRILSENAARLYGWESQVQNQPV